MIPPNMIGLFKEWRMSLLWLNPVKYASFSKCEIDFLFFLLTPKLLLDVFCYILTAVCVVCCFYRGCWVSPCITVVGFLWTGFSYTSLLWMGTTNQRWRLFLQTTCLSYVVVRLHLCCIVMFLSSLTFFFGQNLSFTISMRKFSFIITWIIKC